MAMQLRCPVCQAPLPFEHWRVLADHVVCQKLMPSAPETDHAQGGGAASRVAKGVNRLLSAVEGIVTAVNPDVDLEKEEQRGVDP
jgi:hypothetical protein